MKYLAVVVMIATAMPVRSEQADFSISIGSGTVDRYGCPIRPRPEHLIFTGFRDAWRSVAADDLYSLRRHQMALAADSCDCESLRPNWAIIEVEFEELGFAASSSTDRLHIAWSAKEFFPVISNLRDQLRAQCPGAE
ncbi:hypothetical protein J4717_13820 [Phaeobacter sp. HS012]|uniref:hypothetical protein n=1 Tax=unclassified Phaeobacter TaxID=2621772 RepID=UPI001B39452F|nr:MULTISPECIES: hypothetical protein [unclassified Phaeobacter]MBQ4808549.1 hypothetical protein [Phaeobacter sp. HS012]MBQ4883232.1 hypothetical protein [Phaeobacter sp. HS011]